MRPTRHINAVFLATLVAAGCSKSGEPRSTAGSSEAVQPRPVATTTAPVTVRSTNEASDASIAPTASASFADGEAAYQAKKYGDATAIFEGYTERRPANAWGHYMLGLSAWKNGDLAKAEKAFDTALSIDPRHVKSLVNRSRVYVDQKRYEEAIDRLSRAAEIAPESADVYRLLGRTYHARGETGEAVDAYRRAIELNDHDAWSMSNLGLLFVETKRPADALPLLARAVELRKDVPEFHNNLGMALEHTGRFKAAAAAYSGALTADPGYAKAKQNLTRVEAIKVGSEEPFDLREAADGGVAETELAADEKSATN